MARRRRGKGSKIVWVLVLLALIAGAYVWLRPSADHSGKDAKNQSVPVITALVQHQDIPVYLGGIGTVLSPHQVVVRSRVDGELMKVHFTEGQEVKEGALLAEIDPRPIRATLAQARAERARTDAQLKTAQLDQVRYQNLLKDDAIARQQVDQQTALVAQLQAGVASADATIQAAEVQLNYTRILSPLTGRVGIRQVDAGNIIRTSDANGLLTVTQMNPIQVLFSLPQEALPRLQLLENAEPALVEAWTKEGGEKLASGHLEVVDNMVDSATGTVRLKATFENKDRRLWPGQFVVARLQAQMLKDAVVVPARAVQRGRDKSFVWRIADGKAEAVDISIKHENDAWVVIESGIALGETVVVDGQVRLKPGSAVTVSTPDAATTDAPESGQ